MAQELVLERRGDSATVLFRLRQRSFLCVCYCLMHCFEGFLVFRRQFLVAVQAYIVASAVIENDGNEICVVVHLFPVRQAFPVSHMVLSDDIFDGFQLVFRNSDALCCIFAERIVGSLTGQDFLENGLFPGKALVGLQFQAV